MILRRILYPFSLLYGLITSLRNKLYDLNILKSVQFDMPVICVGNLRAGGEGKTPHIEYLIRLLQGQYKIATLSRGYKRKTKGFQLTTTASTAAQVGDEPLQFKRKFPDIQVAVDSNRVLGIVHLLGEHEDTGVILLDDAFQHRAVKAGLNILLTSFAKPYTRDAMLPTGYLRENISGAARANVIVVSKCPDVLSAQQMEELKNELAPLPHQQLFFTRICYGKIKPVNGTTEAPETDTCLLLTGIAKPEPLLAHCQKQFSHVSHIAFADHHAFSLADITRIRKAYEAMGSKAIILTTEKDAMRLQSPQLINACQNLPLYYIPIEIKFLQNEETFRQIILNYVAANKGNN